VTRSKLLFLWLCLILPVLPGCLGGASPNAAMVAARPAACSNFLDALQSEISAAEVDDAAAHSLSGFPYLRSDRFLASLPETEYFSEDTAPLWLAALRDLDRRARANEIRNLPLSARQRLAGSFSLEADAVSLTTHSEACANQLLASDQKSAWLVNTVRQAAQVPDEYHTLYRVAGLYPLTSLPVVYLTDKARRTFRDWHQADPQQLPVVGALQAFMPQPPGSLTLAELFQSVARDWLGLPVLSQEKEQQLAVLLAPVLWQDVVDSDDVPGRVCWQNGAIRVDPFKPTGYYFFSRSFYRQTPVLQVNFVFWFGARKGPWAPRIEQGPLDGLTIRVSLTATGEPFMVDIMNSCGCYHLFVPSHLYVDAVRERSWSLDAFAPTWLPEGYPGQALVLRMNAGWHQVQKVTSRLDEAEKVRYELRPYEELESLSQGAGAWASLFDTRGVAKGSSRNEYLLLFPMGVSDVGSMRQRGHHAVKLVGREHFDDPQIFNRNFVWSSERDAAKD